MIQCRLAEAVVGGPEDLAIFVDEENGNGFGGVGEDDALIGAYEVAAGLCCFDLYVRHIDNRRGV